MPYKRKESPHWYVRPTIHVPGKGKRRLGPWSTGTKDKTRAQAIERTLKELPMMGYGDLLELVPDEVTPADIHVAKLHGTLDELRRIGNDPKLHPIIDEVRGMVSWRKEVGLDHLESLTTEKDRISLLMDPAEVRKLLHRREREGKVQRNTVRRGMYQAISEVLQHHLGDREEALAILRRVNYSKMDDERHVVLSPAQIKKLVAAARKAVNPLFRQYVVLALSSGIDRSPLLRIQPEHFDERTGELQVFDTKTQARPRRLELGDSAQTALRTAIRLSDAEDGQAVFPWTIHEVRNRWEWTREEAGLEHVRLKDLRAVFATNYLRANPDDIRGLQEILGHKRLETTMRYVKRLPVKSGAGMNAAEEQMKLGGSHLQKEA